jgi:hypothetical protein
MRRLLARRRRLASLHLLILLFVALLQLLGLLLVALLRLLSPGVVVLLGDSLVFLFLLRLKLLPVPFLLRG